MTEPGGFRVNAPLVAVQEIEGEAILINFDTGCYYSANATGAVLLDLAQRGATVAAMVKALAGRCGVAESDVAESVAAFFKESGEGGLLVPTDASAAADLPVPATGATMQFVAPRPWWEGGSSCELLRAEWRGSRAVKGNRL